MSKSNVSILLIGTGSLLNYGCEAIVQGTYVILRTYFPGCQIYLASDDFQYDSKRLPAGINFIQYKKRFTFYRIVKGVLRRCFHIGKGSAVRMNENVGNRFDIVLSCGGDNFCERPDGGIYNLLIDLVNVGKNTIRKGKKYCLWGSSVGPFKNKDNERFIVDALSGYTAVFTREEKSYQYLNQFASLKDKVYLAADPAFCMSADNTVSLNREEYTYVGLNISLLAMSHLMHDSDKNSFQEKMFSQLDKLLASNPRVKYLCIPHVISDVGGPQDDYSFMLRYKEHSVYSNRVELLPKYLGAQKTKGYIAQCDLLIAARMHCCVGGISVGTPTLFLTYSAKGIGMAQYAYGHHEYDMPFDKIVTDEFVNRVNEMMKNKTVIKEHLLVQHERFTHDAMLAGELLKQVVERTV